MKLNEKVYIKSEFKDLLRSMNVGIVDYIVVYKKEGDKVEYSLFEAMYLLETKKAELQFNQKPVSIDDAEKKFSKIDKKFENIDAYLTYTNLETHKIINDNLWPVLIGR